MSESFGSFGVRGVRIVRRSIVQCDPDKSTTVRPQGRSPTGTFLMTFWVATSTIDTSFEGPLAVYKVRPSGISATPQGRRPTSTDPATWLRAGSTKKSRPKDPLVT